MSDSKKNSSSESHCSPDTMMNSATSSENISNAKNQAPLFVKGTFKGGDKLEDKTNTKKGLGQHMIPVYGLEYSAEKDLDPTTLKAASATDNGIVLTMHYGGHEANFLTALHKGQQMPSLFLQFTEYNEAGDPVDGGTLELEDIYVAKMRHSHFTPAGKVTTVHLLPTKTTLNTPDKKTFTHAKGGGKG